MIQTLLPVTAAGAATLVALLVATAALLYLYSTRNFSYWRRRNVPHLKPLPFVGNLLDVVLFKTHFGDFLYDVYKSMKEQKYMGVFLFDQPVLIIKDLSMLKEVLLKDFGHFHARGFLASKYDTMNANTLFSRQGKQWKDLRMKLGPAFTSGKLKKFYNLIEYNARNLDNYFDAAAENGTPENIVDACGRFTTDVVASVGFGIDESSLTNEDTAFRNVLKGAFTFRKFVVLKALGMLARVPLVYYPGSKVTPERITTFLRHSIWATVRHRQETGTVGVRGDYLDLLIELRDKGAIADDDDAASAEKTEKSLEKPFSLEGDAFISQAFTFLTAGFETSSTTMSFALYYLANNHDVQETLRRQLQDAVDDNDGKITYEVLQGIPYLEMILLETLRLQPVMPFLDRTCTETHRFENGLEVEKDTVVMVSLAGLQRDPEYYPDPERFDPERFSETAKRSRPARAFLAFGDGPRLCLGMRLGLLQAKLGLAHLMLNYKFRPCSEKNTTEYDMHSFLLSSKGGIPLLISRV